MKSEPVNIDDIQNSFRSLTGISKYFFWALAISMSLFHIYCLIFFPIDPFLFRVFHLFFASTIAFLIVPSWKHSYIHRPSIYDLVLIIFSASISIYIVTEFDEFIFRFGVNPTNWDIFWAACTIFMVIEYSKRTTGIVLPIIAIGSILYALLGNFLPVEIGHRGYDFARVFSFLFSAEGIYGIPLNASAVYIFLFVLFGAFMSKANIDKMLIDVSLCLTGRLRGGPAKVSVITSSLFGITSGSAVANVMVDGVINIPLMKSTGFKPATSGAIEAMTSTGGQIVPPVMGAAAFLMAEFLGISYNKVAIAAIIPALLYYISAYFMIHFAAGKMGIKGLKIQELPKFKECLRGKWHLFFPIIILIFLIMVLDYSPIMAVFYAILSTIFLSWFGRTSRIRVLNVLEAFTEGAKGSINIASTTAIAGIIVGVLSLTGLGTKFSSIIISLSLGYLPLALVLTMIASLILGMGMPTIAAYAIASSVAAPALIKLGVSPISAHFFVFYFSILSAITPPVALAAYAAATIAGASMWEVGFLAVKFALAAFIIPFMFAYNPVLLFQGPLLYILWATLTGSIGCIALSASVQGYFLTSIKLWERLILFVSALFLVSPEIFSDFVGGGIFLLILVRGYIKKRRSPDNLFSK